jgi:CheY-like chemotaxis protein
LRLAIENTPDLVVLDMMIPKLPGPEVLCASRKNPGTASIPVIILTSLPQYNAEKLLGEGAAAYLEKSLLAVDKGSRPFLDVVERILARSAQAKAAAASSS